MSRSHQACLVLAPSSSWAVLSVAGQTVPSAARSEAELAGLERC
jgi:hypothetical protein